jgi:NADH-quinone oxidoreductase subunit A
MYIYYTIYDFIYVCTLAFGSISFIFSAIIALLTGIISFDKYNKDLELRSTYECGFIPFEEQRLKIDISFYIVAILFIVFDLEIIFLFPWSVAIYGIGYLGFYVVVIFFIILSTGLYLEFKLGVLNI